MWQYAGSGGPATPAPSADAESAVRDLVQDFTTHFNTGNYDQCAAIFLPEGQLMISHREATHGQRGVERMLRELADGGYQDLRFETVRVDAAGDRAIEIGRYTASVRLSNGKTVADRGSYLASWHRLGIWRIAAHCFSSSVPRTWQDAQERQLRTIERPEVISHDVPRPA
jgi:uncharacterized protein (TIGR02246 family)